MFPLPRKFPFCLNWVNKGTICPLWMSKPHRPLFLLPCALLTRLPASASTLLRIILGRRHRLAPLSWSLAHTGLPLSETSDQAVLLLGNLWLLLITHQVKSRPLQSLCVPACQPSRAPRPVHPSLQPPGPLDIPWLAGPSLSWLHTHLLTAMLSPVPLHQVFRDSPQGKLWKHSSSLLIQT